MTGEKSPSSKTETITSEAEVIRLGRRIAKIHSAADKEFLDSWFVVTSDNERWVKRVNSKLSSFPKVIRLGDAAELAFIRYAAECGKIDDEYRPMAATFSFLANLVLHNPVQVGLSFWRLLSHGAARGRVDASNRVNQACADIAANYALLSLDPAGCVLARGEWWVFDYIRSSARKCRAGLHLEGKVRITAGSKVKFLNEVTWD